MNRYINIELYEGYDAVSFYTLKFKGEETEFDKFQDKFPEGCEYDDDMNIIYKWYDIIAEKGALERYFNPRESKIYDNLVAIPVETSKLRLYCLRINDNILIIGNGGVKKTRTYNEDPELNNFVETLQTLDKSLKSRIQKGQITVYQNDLFGNLKFTLKDKHEKK